MGFRETIADLRWWALWLFLFGAATITLGLLIYFLSR